MDYRQLILPINAHMLNFQEYGSGHMLTGEIKKILIEVLTDLVERHRRARAAVTDEVTVIPVET